MSSLVFADEALDEGAEDFRDAFSCGETGLVLWFDFADPALDDPRRDDRLDADLALCPSDLRDFPVEALDELSDSGLDTAAAPDSLTEADCGLLTSSS